MGREFKQQTGGEDESGTGLNYQVPDTRETVSALNEAIRNEHMEIMEEEDKEDKKNGKKPKKREKRNKAICFCGNPTCRIGPFTGTASEDAGERDA